MGRAFGGFLRTQVILAGIQAALVAVVGTIFGIPYLFLVGTLSTLAMLIPFFGPPLALIPPIVAAWIYVPQWFLVITIILVVVQTVVVNWLQPRLMQGALGMHPILVLVGLLVGAQVAGVWGALFGIPLIAVFNVFLNLVLFSELPNAALPAGGAAGGRVAGDHGQGRARADQRRDAPAHPRPSLAAPRRQRRGRPGGRRRAGGDLARPASPPGAWSRRPSGVAPTCDPNAEHPRHELRA